MTGAVKGEDAVAQRYLEDSRRLSEVLGQELWRFHELDVDGCPVMHRTGTFLDLAERNYRLGHFNPTLFESSFSFSSAEEAYKVLQDGKNLLQSRVLLHGDYFLPNVMLQD
ncbi:phosphotransferase [Streptococcus sp. NLN76]|uniref:phosphotransferase n=1 Tax=Streptococcus sp. NLN76 TaxID=2822800 RepID=UPI001FFD0DFA|nr:phosphotransferase [Streptococcus sp. NLN76]